MDNNETIINIVKEAYDAVVDKKGEKAVILDISKISVVSDYFLITAGNNVNHVKTLADAVEKKLAKIGRHPKHVEGKQSASWILLDYEDFIVHVFGKEDREFYNIEHIWGDAALVEV